MSGRRLRASQNPPPPPTPPFHQDARDKPKQPDKAWNLEILLRIPRLQQHVFSDLQARISPPPRVASHFATGA
ncbi:uncharacterized protein VDAG_06494 [Verticillium dahliae VdLs.17]|uniref:Uncharacterized protein n=1 Tax=Verticillium dahliae (strain VdLs.17 / ATCC MYA-4575 / FGSC 10137) TaxID=498257 RepID=G2X7N6_VERDV|nr:uncharacterized protein VDAG_06494 [Verticillium dahliae VdLs.17]EGY15004.1 hypothetical protein VDAG_06494 [Verticillium dahliae VdLs.17]